MAGCVCTVSIIAPLRLAPAKTSVPSASVKPIDQQMRIGASSSQAKEVCKSRFGWRRTGQISFQAFGKNRS